MHAMRSVFNNGRSIDVVSGMKEALAVVCLKGVNLTPPPTTNLRIRGVFQVNWSCDVKSNQQHLFDLP
jgi:hypothetical protein